MEKESVLSAGTGQLSQKTGNAFKRLQKESANRPVLCLEMK
jgi:hypothetical protein